MIDIERLKADREAGTDGPWEVQKSPFEVINRDHGFLPNHIIAGDNIMLAALYPENIEDPDARRIARLPDLEATYIEVVAKLDKAVEALQEMLSRRRHPIGFYWRNGAQFTSEYGNEYESTSDVISSCKEDVGYLEAVIALITAKPERDG